MSYASNEMEHTTCDVCGHEKKCFVNGEGEEQEAVCPDCLRQCSRET